MPKGLKLLFFLLLLVYTMGYFQSFHIMQQYLVKEEITISDSKLMRKAGQSWITFNWKDNTMLNPSDTDGSFQCKWTKFKSDATNREAEMCVHPFPDVVSNFIVRHGKWYDCNLLSTY